MSVTLGLQTALILLLSEWPKLYGVLAILGAVGLNYKNIVKKYLRSLFKQGGQVCEDNNIILIHNTHLFIYEFKCIFQLLSMSMFYIFFSVRMVQYLC